MSSRSDAIRHLNQAQYCEEIGLRSHDTRPLAGEGCSCRFEGTRHFHQMGMPRSDRDERELLFAQQTDQVNAGLNALPQPLDAITLIRAVVSLLRRTVGHQERWQT